VTCAALNDTGTSFGVKFQTARPNGQINSKQQEPNSKQTANGNGLTVAPTPEHFSLPFSVCLDFAVCRL
jgi:hypothetical protein